MRQRVLNALAMEEVLGTNWLNKLGIIILVLGVALFGIYELGELGPTGKVAMSYAVSVVLLGAGIYLERRERYLVLGRTCIGGGWALLFFTSYALNHVASDAGSRIRDCRPDLNAGRCRCHGDSHLALSLATSDRPVVPARLHHGGTQP